MGVAERIQGANVIDAGRLSPYWGEHVARYVLALQFVENKRVLDIACGTGYGLATLKKTAASVTGVDVDLSAATEAKNECDDRVAVLLGDGRQLPFADENFDVVTSFETLEHLNERSRFLGELNRVLRADGTLILSTPNANYTNPIDGKPTNPFHIFEYSPQELRVELDAHFQVHRFLGQTLSASIQIPPFQDAQLRLPKDAATQAKLFGWKVLNKTPFAVRERISNAIWRSPFYPTENDYQFSETTVESAPVLVAVCGKV